MHDLHKGCTKNLKVSPNKNDKKYYPSFSQQITWLLAVFFSALILSPALLADTSSVSKKTIELIKAKNDPRSYRYIKLKNGITAVLISDPNAQKAAAAIDVGVGSFENPVGKEGLAHFLEHVLFLGNSKYPDTKK